MRRHSLWLWSCLLFILLLVPGQEARAAWQQKMAPGLWQTAVSQPTTEFIIRLNAQADLGPAAAIANKEARGQWVYTQLTAVARQTQPAVLTALNAAGADHQPFWIANLIWVRGDAALLAEMAQRPEVARLYANPQVALELPVTPTPANRPAAPVAVGAVEWNIDKVNAPYAWSQGITGQGVVIGGQDTGYQWDHPALKNTYRGWNDATQTANHDYNWHDAFNDNPCGFSAPAPCDDNGHGTHTMGTIVGDDGGSNQIGVAPGARWIGCRNMDNGIGSPASYIACYQWFLAPTDLNDANPRPDLAPHIINNSWYCPSSEGCTEPDVLLPVVQNVRAAGILTVHSAGNSGPACGTIQHPAGTYAESFTVGNVTSSDVIAASSSRGPATFNGLPYPYLKPNVVAPGTNVRSAYPNDSYATLSGTSMAAPHVAGVAALLIDAQPGLVGQVSTVETILQATAVPLTTTEGCGGDSPTSIPNHTYGYGRVDARQALLFFGQKLFLPVVTRAETQ